MKKITLILFITIFGLWSVNIALAQGNAIKFSGNPADQVQAEDSPSLDISGKEFTMEAWVYPTEVGDYIIIVNKENSWEMALHQGLLYYAINAPNWKWWGQGNVELNKWSHVAVTYDGKETVGWLNGKKVNSTKENSANINPTNEPFNIGWRPFGTHYPFFGIIDEVRISKTVRYTKDFKVPDQQFETDADTAALYHLDEGKGKTTKDSSGNKNDAKLIGGPEWVKSDAPFTTAVEPDDKLAVAWGAVKMNN
ncbi:MAG: LamG domain-containing protein [Candidatus Poribacteria bacterium]